MKIAIDATRAVIEKAGIGRHVYELTKNLIELDTKNEYLLIFSYVRRDPEKEKIISSFKRKNVEIKTLKLPGTIKEKLIASRFPLYNGIVKKADVFLAPSILELPIGLNKPSALIIYDMTTFLFPEQRGKEVSERHNKITENACQKADKIISISESTKEDLVRLLGIDEKKIEVIYPGLNRLKTSKNLPEKLQEKKYILAVGTIEPRKNLKGLFEAYSYLSDDLQKEYPLVVVGAKGWNTGETYETLTKYKLEDKVKFLGYVSDSELGTLYRDAKVLVYPSFYEGFGFPVIEAMQFGTPVVTSKISSLPEAAGNVGVYIDPKNPRTISEALQRQLRGENKVSPQALIKQANSFSWQDAAKKTLDVLEEVVNE